MLFDNFRKNEKIFGIMYKFQNPYFIILVFFYFIFLYNYLTYYLFLNNILLFYVHLGFWYFVQMLFFICLAIIGNFWLGSVVNLLYGSLIIFIVAWIGQFYGHHIEGKKPSFAKDLQFLLIGPLWVVKKISLKNK